MVVTGRLDIKEGSYLPLGLHWGFILETSQLGVPREMYACLNLPLLWKKEIRDFYSEGRMVAAKLRLIVLFARPLGSLPEGRPRHKFALAWLPER